jgi:Second Messenger Oligonucleotide or Dinucleotide Synthetase domain
VATLPSYFMQALSRIEPGPDADNAKKAHAEVSAALKAAAPLGRLGVSPVLIGSYAREVSIRRVKDVDVFGRLQHADRDLRPGRAIDLFEDALAGRFGEKRVERQARSVKVSFDEFDLSVDAVPARPQGNHWEIPKKTDQDNRTSWIETNPTKLTELSTETNKKYTLNGKGIYVPVVKLVRQVRRVWVRDQPGGLFFEILTYWAFNDGKPKETSHASYLVTVLDYIEKELPVVAEDGLRDPTLHEKIIETRATEQDFNDAIREMTKAARLARTALAEEDDCRAALAWLQLLGENTEGETVFPMPEYCTPDGTWRSGSATIKGAVTAPAGSGRYA